MIPKLVIIGRPNVGKSTLFNRLLGRRRALVHDEPGVTRDRLEETAQWVTNGKKVALRLIDTGGLGEGRFEAEIREQVYTALKSADVVLVVFDGQTGITDEDKDILKQIREADIMDNIPVAAVVNKVDIEKHEDRIHAFYEAGLDPILTISAEHDRGIDDLKKWVVDSLESKVELDSVLDDEESEPEPRVSSVAVVGKPNVGKSTFLNALIGTNRMITSPIAGTTVDAVDTLVELNGKPYLFIDTAGIRRKSKTEKGIEVLSVLQTRKALERAQLVILLIDAQTGPVDQDEKIAGMIEKAGCSVVIAVNKWDLQKNKNKFSKEDAAKQIRKQMPFLSYAPILFLSAKNRTGFDDLNELIDDILHQRRFKVPTHEFTEWVRGELDVHNPHDAKFYLCHQSGSNPPTFVFHVNNPDKVHFSLSRHLVNGIRKNWGYMGSPIRMVVLKAKGGANRSKFGNKNKNHSATK